MKDIIEWLNDSSYIPPLPPACEMCARGSKLVVLITGLCPANCFYCPLSFKKGGKDVIYADEWKLDDENDTAKLIQEAEYIEAEGAGITGGDPLIVWQRVKRYIHVLKDEYGSSFHIHLYTSALKNWEYIPEIVSAGLDEIRFHPEPIYWKNMDESPIRKAIELALENPVDAAIEIPVIPGVREDIISIIEWADRIGIKWVNLNELEFSERNADNFIRRGFDVKDDTSAAVKGSEETAKEILKGIEEKQLDIGVHYCSSSFKDGIQLRNRIMRRAKNIVKPHEVITEDGTLLFGIIQPSNEMNLENLESLLKNKYGINEFHINSMKNRVETSIPIIRKLACRVRGEDIKCFIIEEYPTADRLEVERIPLP